MTVVELPWPPSVNHYWRLGQGHFHVSTEGRRYKSAVAAILEKAGIRPVNGPVKITIDAYPPDRRRRDIDNLEKALLDACCLPNGGVTGLYYDDSQIKRKESTMWEFDADRAGRVIVSRTPWDGVVPIPAADVAALKSKGGDLPWQSSG